LQEQGHDVQLVTRTSEQSDMINLNGVSCIRKNGVTAKRIPAIHFESFFAEKQNLIIVTTKQTHLPVFLEWAKHRFESHIPILFMQNGMGHIEHAKEVLANPLFFGVVTHGAFKNSLNEVKHTGIGHILVGGIDEHRYLLSPLWCKDSRFPIEWSDSMVTAMSKKLLMNAVINPLTAIHQVKNGSLLTNESLKIEAYEIFDEARKILGFPKEMWDEVVDVIRLTGENESSMNVDLQSGRKTEVDTITGYLLMRAKDNECLSEKIQHIHNQIKRLERKGEDD
jgi:2-dehydropantoate 2-reductase